MSSIQRITMVILMQPDLASAVSFYKNLGFKLKFYMTEKWAEFELDGVKIGFCPTSRPADAGDVRTGIVLEVDDLYALHKELAGQVTFIGEPYEAVHGIMVSFRDPGGNILDLYQPTPEKVKDLIKKAAAEDEAAAAGGCCGKKPDACC